ncbi:MAG: hypothetical protein MRJ65_07040 [Candidatus Brocadiaceae bacterium]|nr:hypothetical protein [Candidatus Brocadiaceae bacterium]
MLKKLLKIKRVFAKNTIGRAITENPLINWSLWIIVVFLLTAFPLQRVYPIAKTVIVIQSRQMKAYNDTVEGFTRECDNRNIFVKTVYDLKGNIEEGRRVLQNIKESKGKPDLVFSVGVLATTLARDYFPDIPIIFSLVINHEQLNLAGANISGISLEAPLEKQFATFKKEFGLLRNIGIIYNSRQSAAFITKIVSEAKKSQFTIVEKEVKKQNELSSTLKRLSKKIDALLLIPDELVVTKKSLSIILKVSRKHRIPVFCGSSAIVKAGALFSISPDFTCTGRQASQMAQTLLQNPEMLSLGIQDPEKLRLTLNTETAKDIGISLSSFLSRFDIHLYP